MCKFENIMNVNKTDFNNKGCNKCVSFLHSTRIKINDNYMKQRLKAYHKTNKIKLEKIYLIRIVKILLYALKCLLLVK